MHSLVQLATREWMKLHGEEDVWQMVSLQIMATTFPDGQHRTWEICNILLPHSTKVLRYRIEESYEATVHQATLATNTAWYLLLMGQYVEAERHGRNAVAAREMLFSRDHVDTVMIVHRIGLAQSRQGKYKDAEVMHRRVLEGYDKEFGSEHPDTLISVHYLGEVLEQQGKYKEAISMHRRALEAYEKSFGYDCEHPETLTSLGHLGSVLQRQGQYEEAEEIYRRAVQEYKKSSGYEHSSTQIAVLDGLRKVLLH